MIEKLIKKPLLFENHQLLGKKKKMFEVRIFGAIHPPDGQETAPGPRFRAENIGPQESLCMPDRFLIQAASV